MYCQVEGSCITDGYFTVCSYLSWVSDFQLHSDFLMAASINLKLKVSTTMP